MDSLEIFLWTYVVVNIGLEVHVVLRLSLLSDVKWLLLDFEVRNELFQKRRGELSSHGFFYV